MPDAVAGGTLVTGLDLAALPPPESPAWESLARAFDGSGMLVLRTGGDRRGDATPAQVESFYTAMHTALGLTPVPSQREPGVGSSGGRGQLADNLRGAGFPGAVSTNILGSIGALESWHGLSGRVSPATWWERDSISFHHDGAFTASAGDKAVVSGAGAAPPLLLQMYCAESPSDGGRVTGTAAGGRVKYDAGATLLLSLTHAFAAAPPALQARARRMVAVYSNGFGKVVEGEYPRMADTGLRPLRPSPADQQQHAAEDEPQLWHPIVVEHPATGVEHLFGLFIFCDHLEDRETGETLSWEESQVRKQRHLSFHFLY
eukprot:COSAG06_NODE_3114_length_5840_cov_26.926842_3_plen_317_part_00